MGVKISSPESKEQFQKEKTKQKNRYNLLLTVGIQSFFLPVMCPSPSLINLLWQHKHLVCLKQLLIQSKICICKQKETWIILLQN